ncbi:hypothetical protein WJ972_09890 [Achromobacter insuavis]
MLTAATTLYLWGWEAVLALAALARAALIQGLGMNVSAVSVVSLIGRVGADALHIVAPFALTVGAAALLANVAQTGPVWSTFPLAGLEPHQSRHWIEAAVFAAYGL